MDASQAKRGRRSEIAGPEVNPHAETITAEELSELVRSFYGMKTLLIDPVFAKEILTYNTANRRINRRKLKQFVHQMQTGSFENTGEGLIISAEGILNNGQHRLEAIVESGVTVDLDVRFGIPRKAFTKTDTGASRNGADVLTIKGVAGGVSVAPAVRLLVLYKKGLPDSIRDFVSNDEIHEAFEKWSGIAETTVQVNSYDWPKGVKTTPLYAAAYMASRSPLRAKLPDWLFAVSTGLVDGSRGGDNPAYQLRERLMRGIESPVGTRESLVEKFALMIKSWNLFAAGETVSKRDFRWKQSGKGMEAFPKVDGARF